MKKYNRKQPLIPPKKIIIMQFLTIVILAILWILSEKEEFVVIGIGAFFSWLLVLLFSVIPTTYKYAYTENSIKLFHFGVKYGEVNYKDFSYICISNASYNNGYGYGIYANFPMKFKTKNTNDVKTMTYPFLTLHKSNYPIQKIKNEMYSRDLFMLDSQNIFCLGICWCDSLEEILLHTNFSVYILEDVYIRFEKMFDSIFEKYNSENERIFIVP